MKQGYFLEIEPHKAAEDALLYSGCIQSNESPGCSCPNCGTEMFHVFSIHRSVGGLPNADIYDEKGFLVLDVCPACSHSLRNYFIKVEGPQRIAGGGYIDGKGASNFIDKPYRNRAVTLIPIPENSWDSDDFIDDYRNRKLLNGVLHQLGGKKIKSERNPLSSCICCGGSLDYLATIDYDDLNVPLYEKSNPCALVIGDMQSLNVFVCSDCNALNYGITVE